MISLMLLLFNDTDICYGGGKISEFTNRDILLFILVRYVKGSIVS